MLKRLELENYRCYKKAGIDFKKLSIIAGKNNAGKSTIIEALRLVSSAGKRLIKAAYVSPPESFMLSDKSRGIKLDIDKLKIDLRGIVYYYENKTAVIRAYFDDKTRIEVYLNSACAFSRAYDENGRVLSSRAAAGRYGFASLNILPQLGLIKENEKLLSRDTVINSLDTYLSSKHFRNELLLFRDRCYDKFKRLSELTWDGLHIRSLDYNIYEGDIEFFVEDDRFTAEIGLMGSGLQMWLQIIWFISRTSGKGTIVLDEPDVYMHPDLQRKILKIAKKNYRQVVIATHSVEIISEAETESIVTADKRMSEMRYANELLAVKRIIYDIRGIQNLAILRIIYTRMCIFIEKKNLEYLSLFHNILYPDSQMDLGTLPSIEAREVKEIPEAFEILRMFSDEMKGRFKGLCILNRGININESCDFESWGKDKDNLYLHIWYKRELENYLLKPRIIFRITGAGEERYPEFLSRFEKIIDGFRSEVAESYMRCIYEGNKSRGAAYADITARKYVGRMWETLDGRTSIVPGRQCIKKLSEFIRDEYRKECSVYSIIESFKSSEVDDEIRRVIDKIDG